MTATNMCSIFFGFRRSPPLTPQVAMYCNRTLAADCGNGKQWLCSTMVGIHLNEEIYPGEPPLSNLPDPDCFFGRH